MLFGMSAEQPWLDNKAWKNNSIASDARRAHWVMWGVALLWNLVSLPLLFQFEDIWQKVQREPLTALAFLFPLVGLALIVLAINATRQKRRFGLTPLVMDPFPGSLGGQLGGRIETNIPFDPGRHFDVSLTCVHSRISGSGKNRSRSESVVWRGDGVCHTGRGSGGTMLEFRFDVPSNLPASQPHQSGNYHLWRVSVSADLPGIDFNRSYNIPVFATGEQNSTVEKGTESHPATVDAAMDGVNSVADIRSVPGGIEAYFPALQRPAQGVFTLVFGLFFAAIGIGLGVNDKSLFMSSIFFLVGAVCACFGIFYLGKSLAVSVNREGLRSRRFLFGYPLTTRKLAVGDVRKIEIKQGATMQSGNKKTVYYQLYAHGRNSRAFPLAERLTARAEAELLRDTYVTYLGIELHGNQD